MEEAQNQTVAEVLNNSAVEPTTVCYMLDSTHQVCDITTVSDILTNDGMFDWATAVVTSMACCNPSVNKDYLRIEAELQSSVERSKRLENAENLISSIDEDIVAINDMLQQPTVDLKRVKDYIQHISNHIKQHKNKED